MLRQVDNGTMMTLRVRAGSSREALVGRYGDAFKVAVRTAPEKGKANKTVIRLLAKALGVPAARLTIVHGETSPDKEVLVEGLDPNVVNARMEDAMGGGGAQA